MATDIRPMLPKSRKISVALFIDSIKPSFGGPAVSSVAIKDALANQGVSIDFTPLDQVKTLKALMGVCTSMSGTKIVHLYGIWSIKLFLIAVCAIVSNKRLVVSTLGMLEPWSLKQSRVKKYFALRTYQGLVINRASYLHATSSLEASNLKMLFPDKDILVIPHGVSISEDLDHASVSLRDTTDQKVIVFMSRLHEKKGVEELLTAWQHLPKNHHKLIIVGGGEPDYVRSIGEKVSLINKSGCDVTMTGDLRGEKKTAILRSADLFILPTFSENFGLVIAEALSEGLPVITTPYAPWSWIEEQSAGWIVEPDPKSIAGMLEKVLLLDRLELKKMGARGREYLKANYSWSAAGEKHLKAYESIAI